MTLVFVILVMVMKMRVYYVFPMKEEFAQLYQNSPRTLYNILRQIYYMHKEDVHYGFNLFQQIIERIDKHTLDQQLFLKLHQEIDYSKRGNLHYVNNLYRDEVSTLEIKNTHMKIETNHDFSSFFRFLDASQANYFVCDFVEQDYFWLKEIKTLV